MPCIANGPSTTASQTGINRNSMRCGGSLEAARLGGGRAENTRPQRLNAPRVTSFSIVAPVTFYWAVGQNHLKFSVKQLTV
jgi:hypothetical protein